jgi:hypothetical protein
VRKTPKQKKTSLKINAEIYKQAKIEATKRDITMAKLMETALRKEINA